MTRRQSYFAKQKLIGLGAVIIGILPIVLWEIGELAFILVPMGLYMMFTKEMVLMDSYYFDMEEEREFRRKMRRRGRSY